VQRELYDIVLRAQLTAISHVKRGEPFDAPHRAALDVMVDGLIDLGLLDGDKQEVIETERYKRFCLHKSSHWLGLDVHDVGDYLIDRKWRELEPGMVLTVEPGIYIPDEDDIPRRFRGIGIRIEDDVLVTPSGNEVLTAAAPKTVKEIEATMRGRR
jgi:Xaa-Pro aminopeptidase